MGNQSKLRVARPYILLLYIITLITHIITLLYINSKNEDYIFLLLYILYIHPKNRGNGVIVFENTWESKDRLVAY